MGIHHFVRPQFSLLPVAYAVASVFVAGLAQAQAVSGGVLPTGGQVVAGQATIGGVQGNQGSRLDIRQQSQNAAINWQTFNIGADAQVNFIQPSASSITLNRVLGQDPSTIQGRISANGQVFVLNPNGVLFGKGAQVNVGGLVASTLNLSNDDFMAGRHVLTATPVARVGSTVEVVNQGTITAVNGGYVIMAGGQVRNEGRIYATSGSVALAAGEKVTVNLEGNKLIGLSVDKGVINALAENKGLISAGGGQVLLTAKAADAIIKSVVNNEGIIEANTLVNVGGVIKLIADGGETRVAGTLSAAAPNGGDGGFIETSADRVSIAANTKITTAAPAGKTGRWLIDPTDFTIAASGGDIDGATLSSYLGSNNVTIASVSGATAGNGDIFVNDNVSWSKATTLTLDAQRHIDFSGGGRLDGGVTGNITLNAGLGATDGAIIAHASNTVVTGNTLIANALTGIGSGAQPLRTQVAQAALTNTISGGITLRNTGDITVAANSVQGDISVVAENGFNGSPGGAITVSTVAGLSGITTQSSGDVLLASGKGGDDTSDGGVGGVITVNKAITTAGSTILFAGSGGNSQNGLGAQGGAITLNADVDTGKSLIVIAGNGGQSAAQQAGNGGALNIMGTLSAGWDITLFAGNGGQGGTAGGSGGNVTTQAAMTAGTDVMVYSGSGGSSGTDKGGSGGTIQIASGIKAAGMAILVAGSGSDSVDSGGGSGGSITLNGVMKSGDLAYVSAGHGGDGFGNTGSASGGPGGAVIINAPVQAGSDLYLLAGNGGGNQGFTGAPSAGSGGSITVNAALTAVQSALIRAGSGGNSGGGAGGDGGTIDLNVALVSGGAASLYAGHGGDGVALNGGAGGTITLNGGITSAANGALVAGDGGSGDPGLVTSGGIGGAIHVNVAQRIGADALFAAGAGGSGATSANSGQITGSNMDIAAVGNLTMTGDVHAAGGNVSLKAGLNPGNVLTLGGAVLSVAGTSKNNVLLQGFDISFPGKISANQLTISTVGVVGTQLAPISISANRLSLQGNGAFIGNDRAIVLDTINVTDTILINNGANAITVENPVVSTGAGDAIRLAGSKFINLAGAGGLSTPNGRWIVWSDTPVNNNFGGLQSGQAAMWGTPFDALSPTTGSMGNRFVFSQGRPAFALIKTNDLVKTYGDSPSAFTWTTLAGDAGVLYGNAFTDAGSAVVLSGAPSITSAGAAATATRNGGNSGGATYDITADVAAITGTVNGSPAALQTVAGTLTIAPRPVSAQADVQNVVYGAAVAPLTFTVNNLASFDTAANAFTGALTRSTGAMSNGGYERAGVYGITQGTLAANANYSLTGFAGANYTITPRQLAVSGLTANDRVYDTSVNAGLSGTAVITALGADTVTLMGSGVATFADKNAGMTKPVTIGGFTLTGADAGNYTIVQPAGLTADITKAQLSVTGVTANNRVYDTTTNATLSGTAAVTTLGTDSAAVGGTAIATFIDKSAGVGKPVTVAGFTLIGADAGNYTIVQPVGLTADISQAQLSVTGVTANNRVYDATTNATLSGTAAITTLGSDSVTLLGTGIATFADKNAGLAKSVTVTGYGVTGADAGNYVLVQPAGLVADIVPRSITGTVTVSNKVYDGATTASIGSRSLVGVLAGDNVSYSGGVAVFSDKNAGNGKTVAVNNLVLGGVDAANYAMASVTTGTADITPAMVSITAGGANKVFGDADPTFTFTTSGLVGGDSPSAVFTGALARVPGENVSGSPYVIALGTLAANSNYTIGNYTPGQFTITPRPLSVIAQNSSTISGDALPAFSVSYSGFAFTDGPAKLNGSLRFSTTATAASAPGSYNITPSGYSASNYSISYVDGVLDVLGVVSGVMADNPLGNNTRTTPAAQVNEPQSNALSTTPQPVRALITIEMPGVRLPPGVN